MCSRLSGVWSVVSKQLMHYTEIDGAQELCWCLMHALFGCFWGFRYYVHLKPVLI